MMKSRLSAAVRGNRISMSTPLPPNETLQRRRQLQRVLLNNRKTPKSCHFSEALCVESNAIRRAFQNVGAFLSRHYGLGND